MKNIFDDANHVNPAQDAPQVNANEPTQNQAQPFAQPQQQFNQVPPYAQYPYPNPYAANAEQPQSPYAVDPNQAAQAFAPQVPNGQNGFEQPPVNPYVQMPYAQPYYPNPYMQMPYQAMPPMYGQMMHPYGAMTQEQMDQMMQQYAKAQNGEIKEETKEETIENQNGAQPKTRVIFQSEDFDNPEPTEKKVDSNQINLDNWGELITDEHRHEPKEVESPSLEFKPEEKETSAILTTEFGDGFSVFEVEINDKELNVLSRKHPVKVTTLGAPKVEAVAHSNSNEFGTGFDFDVETQEYDENGNPIEKLDFQAAFADDDEDEPKKGRKKAKKAKDKDKTKSKSNNSTGNIIRNCVLVVAILGIIGSSAWLGYEYWLSSQNNNLAREVQDLLIDANSFSTSTDPDTEVEIELTEEEQWALIYAEYPDVDFPDGMLIEYAKLYATNQDMVGYLSIEGLDYSTPIVQGDDDSEYIAKNFYGESTKYACPFMTYLNDPVDFDTNTIIFGHNMSNGSIFAELNEYKTIDGYLEAPVISFDTLTGEYEWKIIAVFITNAYESDDNGYVFKYYFTNLSSETNFYTYLSELESRSLYDTGVDVLPTDKILTLSTCSYEFDDARLVIVARMVRLGESTAVDTSLATVNNNVRYPQAYYDAKGLTNPYIGAYQWEPA